MLLYRKSLNLFIFIFSFLFIFSVNVNLLPNFSYLGITLIPFMIFIHPEYKSIFRSIYLIIRNKLFFIVFSIYSFIILFIVSYATFRGTYDFSFSRSILHSLASIPACIVLSAFIFEKSKKLESYIIPIYNFLKLILYFQVFFIIIMLLFPSIADLINLVTKTDTQLERSVGYQGARGLGLSGSLFFGLAVTMSILIYIVFFMKLIVQNYKMKILDYLIFIITAVAALSAGRTAIAGIILFIISYFLMSIRRSHWFSIVKFLTLIPISVILISLFLLKLDIPSVSRYIFYVYQPIQYYIEYGNFEISSLQDLESMYFAPSNETLFIGDARYVDAQGLGYYMSTDAGFMRVLLFSGLLFSACFYLLWFLLFYFYYNTTRKYLPYSLIFLLSILLMSFIFQYKGEFIFVAVSVNKILFIFIFYFCLVKTKNNLKNKDIQLNH